MGFLRRLLLVFAALSYGAMPFGVAAQPVAKVVAAPLVQRHDVMLLHAAMQAMPIHADHQSDPKEAGCLDHAQGRATHFGSGCCQCAACLVLPVAFQGVHGRPIVGDAPLPSSGRRLWSRSDLPLLPPPRFF